MGLATANLSLFGLNYSTIEHTFMDSIVYGHFW